MPALRAPLRDLNGSLDVRFRYNWPDVTCHEWRVTRVSFSVRKIFPQSGDISGPSERRQVREVLINMIGAREALHLSLQINAHCPRSKLIRAFNDEPKPALVGAKLAIFASGQCNPVRQCGIYFHSNARKKRHSQLTAIIKNDTAAGLQEICKTHQCSITQVERKNVRAG